MRLTLVMVLLFAAVSARPQEVSTVIVPIVGSTFGNSMARWMTDVELINDSPLPLDVAIELPATPEAPALLLTLEPGQVQRFTDIAGQAFGLESVLSPLRVTTGGQRPVFVRATAYAVRGTEISTPEPIEIYRESTWHPIRVLDGLAFSDTFRTNIGIVNTGDEPADVVLALQRIPGRNLAITTVRVQAGSLIHSSIQSLFPLITEGHGFSVVVETGHWQTHAYASVVENASDGARFITARIGAR